MSTKPVTPVRIGAQRRPPAIVLIYTHGEESNDLRKRVMPLRRLGELGTEAATRKMVEAHSQYLGRADLDGAAGKLVGSLIPTPIPERTPRKPSRPHLQPAMVLPPALASRR